MIVVDASVVVTALADDGRDGERARNRLRSERLLAPHLLDLEVVSACRRMVANGTLAAARVAEAITDLGVLRVERAPHHPLLARCWELRANLTVYDAVYVALAERASVLLVTADARLAAAPGTRCAIEVLE